MHCPIPPTTALLQRKTRDPDFAQTIPFEFLQGDSDELDVRFAVYSMQHSDATSAGGGVVAGGVCASSFTTDDPASHTYKGEAVLPLRRLMQAAGLAVNSQLVQGRKKSGSITVRVHNQTHTRTQCDEKRTMLN